ncbi:hypothetical protein [Pedobacter heparinus]|uniref:hypothetical protein n=1 Tax=Pedobacter heparinus TaxID=984 RepID=UPI00292CFBB8|nr:hypothetical protein [Pedobacter heparinus]
MPDISKRLELFNTLKAQALTDLQNENYKTNHPHTYVSIKADGRVKVGTISLVSDSTSVYAIAFAKLGYKENGFSKTTYVKYLIIKQDNEIVEKIDLGKWSLDIVFNVFGSHGHNIPNGIITLNDDPRQQIEYYVDSLADFKEIWDFFVQVNDHCSSAESAAIYKEFYKEQIEKRNRLRDYKYLEEKLLKQEDLIVQYKGLIDKIEALVKKA